MRFGGALLRLLWNLLLFTFPFKFFTYIFIFTLEAIPPPSPGLQYTAKYRPLVLSAWHVLVLLTYIQIYVALWNLTVCCGENIGNIMVLVLGGSSEYDAKVCGVK